MARRAFVVVLLLVLLSACGAPAQARTAVTMEALELPPSGGDVSSVALEADGTIVAIVDGSLARLAPGERVPVVFARAAKYSHVTRAPDGTLYATTATELHTFAAGATTPVVAPIEPTGPLVANGRVEDAHFTFGPSGEVVVSLMSNFPRGYAYRSTNLGRTWTTVPLPGGAPYLPSGSIVIAADGTLYACDPFGFYRSSTGGVSWDRLPAAAPNSSGKLLVAANQDIFFYGVAAGGLRVSRDRGASFQELTSFNTDPFFRVLHEAEPGRLMALANWSSGAGTPPYGPGTIIESTDGGRTWKVLLYVQAHDVAVQGDVVVVGRVGVAVTTVPEHGGLERSVDRGATWQPLGTGTAAADTVAGIEFDRSGNLLARIGQTLYRRVNGSWRTVAAPPGSGVKLGSNRRGVIALVELGLVFLSVDDGVTWQRQTRAFADHIPGSGVPFVPLVLCPRQREDCLVSVADALPGTAIAGNGKLYRVTASGQARTFTGANMIRMVEQTNGDLFATTVNFAGSLRSRDGGDTWSEVPAGSALAFDSQNAFFSVTSTGYALTPAAEGDTPRPFKLEGFKEAATSIRSATFSPDDRLFLVTANGVFGSTTPVRE